MAAALFAVVLLLLLLLLLLLFILENGKRIPVTYFGATGHLALGSHCCSPRSWACCWS